MWRTPWAEWPEAESCRRSLYPSAVILQPSKKPLGIRTRPFPRWEQATKIGVFVENIREDLMKTLKDTWDPKRQSWVCTVTPADVEGEHTSMWVKCRRRRRRSSPSCDVLGEDYGRTQDAAGWGRTAGDTWRIGSFGSTSVSHGGKIRTSGGRKKRDKLEDQWVLDLAGISWRIWGDVKAN